VRVIIGSVVGEDITRVLLPTYEWGSTVSDIPPQSGGGGEVAGRSERGALRTRGRL